MVLRRPEVAYLPAQGDAMGPPTPEMREEHLAELRGEIARRHRVARRFQRQPHEASGPIFHRFEWHEGGQQARDSALARQPWHSHHLLPVPGYEASGGHNHAIGGGSPLTNPPPMSQPPENTDTHDLYGQMRALPRLRGVGQKGVTDAGCPIALGEHALPFRPCSRRRGMQSPQVASARTRQG